MIPARRTLALFVALAVAFVTPVVSTDVAGAAPTNPETATAAVAWLEGRQRPDGGFEVAGFPGFETRDVVLAIAAEAQSGSVWDARAALKAVRAVKRQGRNALNALDDLADDPQLPAGSAAKLVVLTLGPLGLDPLRFDPDCDGGSGRNLLHQINLGENAGTYGAFNDTLYAAQALALITGSVPAATVSAVRAAQQPDGGWGFLGDPDATDVDIDTTAVAIRALFASGATAADPDVAQGLAYLAAQQLVDGSWPSFGSSDPNSTAMAILTVSAAGYDVTTSTWRDTVLPASIGSPYANPDVWLRDQQVANGRIASPTDSFGINTFATAQAVQGLLRPDLPTRTAKRAFSCGGYVTDGFGVAHPFAFKGAPPPAGPSNLEPASIDIVRGIAVFSDRRGGFELDGHGTLRPFGLGGNGKPSPITAGGASWPDQDIARDVVLLPNRTGGFILDGYGGLHPFGLRDHAPPARPTSGTAFWPGWDIARGITILPNGRGGFVLDGFGGLHPFGLAGHAAPARPTSGGAYWPGWDIARKVAVAADGKGGLVMDGFGGMHPFGLNGHAAPPAPPDAPYWPGRDVARGLAL
jgi:hypothetical protein